MLSEEQKARYRRRAAEFRVLAAQAHDPLVRDGYTIAAEAYEKLASWDPPKLAKRG